MAHQPRDVETILAERKLALKNGAKSAFGDAMARAMERQEKIGELEVVTHELEEQSRRLYATSTRRTSKKTISTAGAEEQPSVQDRDAASVDHGSCTSSGVDDSTCQGDGDNSAESPPASPSVGTSASGVHVEVTPIFGPNHDEFRIAFRSSQQNDEIQLVARYSQLAKIHADAPRCDAEFPKKKVFGNRNVDFVHRRADDLCQYFLTAFSQPDTKQHWLSQPLFCSGKGPVD